MNRKLFLAAIAALTATWASGCTQQKENPSKSNTTQAGHEDPDGFYTCPMHPQVHDHDPGTCPICGMALVKVSKKKQEAKPMVASDHGIHATDHQLNLAGIRKYTVKKKDLVFKVPASGRMISPREIAFQVFEADLLNLRAGLEFQGGSAAAPSEILKGKIRHIDTLLDPSSRTVRVLGALSSSPKRFVVDGAFHGEIWSTAKAQLAIPEEAVLHSGGRDLVYSISQDNEIRSVSVTLGRKASREYQVLSGLNEGDVISTGPNFLIDSEAKIRGGGDQAHH